MTAMHGIDGLPAVIDGPIHVLADRLALTQGGAVSSFIGAGGTARTGAVMLDTTNVEAVTGTVVIPSTWATLNVDLLWSNGGTGAGDVVWRADRGTQAVGAAASALTSTTLAAITAPAQHVLQQTSLFTGVAVPTAGSLFIAGVTRMATDAADTLANDAAVVGFLISKAS